MESCCRITELRCKEVINLADGTRMGYVGDVEVDTVCGRVVSLVIPGRCRFFGLFGREEDYIVPWEAIERIGDDIILVRYSSQPVRRERKAWWASAG